MLSRLGSLVLGISTAQDLEPGLGPVLEDATAKAWSEEDTWAGLQRVGCNSVHKVVHTLVGNHGKPHGAGCMLSGVVGKRPHSPPFLRTSNFQHGHRIMVRRLYTRDSSLHLLCTTTRAALTPTDAVLQLGDPHPRANPNPNQD